jgi:hypothetical protein
VRNVAIARDLVRSVDDDHALLRLIRQYAGDLSQHRRLAHARATEHEHALLALHNVFDRGDRAEDGPADTAGQPYDAPAPVTNARDTVQRALDACAVVLAEVADARDGVLDVTLCHLPLAEHDLAVRVPGLRKSPQVHDYLEEFVLIGAVADGLANMRRQGVDEKVQVVCDSSAQV